MLLRRYHEQIEANETKVNEDIKDSQEDLVEQVDTDFYKLTVPELRELAKLAHIEDYGRLKKVELIGALKSAK